MNHGPLVDSMSLFLLCILCSSCGWMFYGLCSSYALMFYACPGADAGFWMLKGGGHLIRSSRKRGSSFGLNVKKPTSWARGQVPAPMPPPPGSATDAWPYAA